MIPCKDARSPINANRASTAAAPSPTIARNPSSKGSLDPASDPGPHHGAVIATERHLGDDEAPFLHGPQRDVRLPALDIQPLDRGGEQGIAAGVAQHPRVRVVHLDDVEALGVELQFVEAALPVLRMTPPALPCDKLTRWTTCSSRWARHC